jgi:hypothetical protein
MRLRLIASGLAVASLLAVGCGGLVDPAKNTTDTFTGTVGVSQAGFNAFTVSNNGEYFVTLTSLTPPLAQVTFPTDVRITAVVGGACVPNQQIVTDNPSATSGKQVLNGVITPGQYCVWVIDQGYFSGPESYVITVNHP